MKAKTIVIGHKNPDSDSVFSAILVAQFGKKIFNIDNIESRVAGELNNESKFVLDLLKLQKPKLSKAVKNEQVILVDTTEMSQVIDGVTEDNLVGVIDHHALGGLKTSKAIIVRTENVGCTCSIIYKILQEKNVKISKVYAKLILAGILSDTLNLTSPTTSDSDRKIVAEISRTANINANELAAQLFAAKSSLKGISIAKIVETDYKDFVMGSYKVGISVWETTDPQTINAKKAEIIKYLKKQKSTLKLNYLLFGVVDILNSNTYCYIIGEEEKQLVQQVLGGQLLEEDVIFLKGIVSRKKQIAAPLMQFLLK